MSSGVGNPAVPRDGVFCATASWRTRMWQRLGFFGRFEESVFDWRQDVPDGGDLIHVETTISISFVDRMRILISGRCELRSYTKTVVPIGKCETRSEFRVMPPAWLR